MQVRFKSSGFMVGAGYNEADGTLRVTFTNRTRTDYEGVPRDVFMQLAHAQDPGRVFNALIRGKYAERRVT